MFHKPAAREKNWFINETDRFLMRWARQKKCFIPPIACSTIIRVSARLSAQGMDFSSIFVASYEARKYSKKHHNLSQRQEIQDPVSQSSCQTNVTLDRRGYSSSRNHERCHRTKDSRTVISAADQKWQVILPYGIFSYRYSKLFALPRFSVLHIGFRRHRW